MDVVLGLLRHVVVDDVGDARDVEPALRDVGGDEDLDRAALELLDRITPLFDERLKRFGNFVVGQLTGPVVVVPAGVVDVWGIRFHPWTAAAGLEISVDELYDYVCQRVRERSPNQTPGMAGDVRGQRPLAEAPDFLLERLEASAVRGALGISDEVRNGFSRIRVSEARADAFSPEDSVAIFERHAHALRGAQFCERAGKAAASGRSFRFDLG